MCIDFEEFWQGLSAELRTEAEEAQLISLSFTIFVQYSNSCDHSLKMRRSGILQSYYSEVFTLG